MKFVKPLSDVELLTLQEAQRHGPTSRLRQRALSVLLSAQGLRIAQLVKILGMDRDTVSGWLDAWEAPGLRGLYDAPRAGRPALLTQTEQQWLCEQLRTQPRPLRQVQGQLQESGKAVSVQTLKRVLKKRASSGSARDAR
jgi:transposase